MIPSGRLLSLVVAVEVAACNLQGRDDLRDHKQSAVLTHVSETSTVDHHNKSRMHAPNSIALNQHYNSTVPTVLFFPHSSLSSFSWAFFFFFIFLSPFLLFVHITYTHSRSLSVSIRDYRVASHSHYNSGWHVCWWQWGSHLIWYSNNVHNTSH